MLGRPTGRSDGRSVGGGGSNFVSVPMGPPKRPPFLPLLPHTMCAQQQNCRAIIKVSPAVQACICRQMELFSKVQLRKVCYYRSGEGGGNKKLFLNSPAIDKDDKKLQLFVTFLDARRSKISLSHHMTTDHEFFRRLLRRLSTQHSNIAQWGFSLSVLPPLHAKQFSPPPYGHLTRGGKAPR